MLKRYHRIVGGIFRVVDAAVIAASWLLSFGLRFYLPIVEVTKGFPSFETYASLTPFIMILWSFVFSSMKVYQSQRMLRRTHEAHLLLKAHLVSLILFISLTYMFSEYKYSRGVVIYFGVLGGFFIVFFRLLLRNFLRNIRRNGYNLRHVLIIGEGAPMVTLVKRIDQFPELGLRIVGAVVHPSSRANDVSGKKVVGHFSELSDLIKKFEVDQILIALPKDQYGELDQMLAHLKDETVDIQLVPDIHEYVTLGCEIEDFDGLPVVHLNDSPLNGWGAVMKRTTDILISGIALLFFAPIFFIISVAIKLTSRGPIFYSQERMGLDGRTFKMYKFRSMRVDAEAESGAVWAQENDSRKTRLGSFLRATSLDELPQFWNVFKGEMSLVGPRPERPVFVSQFKKEIPNYMLRHKVKAGLTGWAQVNGWRGNTSLDRRIECDIYYIRNWSYLLDWKIMFITLWKGFVNKNAY